MKAQSEEQVSQTGTGASGRFVNALLVAGILLLNAGIYFLLPSLHLRPWAALISIACAALSTPLFWALVHEAIHGGLWPERRVNRALGRLLAVIFGAPFMVLRAGHLMHHRRNRSRLDRTEVYDPAVKSWWQHAAVYYPRLLGGLYLVEVASGLLGWLPQTSLRRLLARQFHAVDQPERQERLLIQSELLGARALRAWRVDALLVVLLFASAFAVYGSEAYLLVFYLVLRGLSVSLLDNSYHYATALDETRFAMNLRLPRLLGFTMLHFNLHGVHHAHVRASWHELQALFQGGEWHYHGSLPVQVLRQLRGPIPITALSRPNGR